MKKNKFLKTDMKSVSKAYGLLTTLALNIVIIIGAMFFLGNFIDKKLGTSPLFMFIFLLLGIGAAFRNMYILSIRSMPNPKKKYEYVEDSKKEVEDKKDE